MRSFWLTLVFLAAGLGGTLCGACTKTETVEARTQIMLRISSTEALQASLTSLRVSVSLREGNGWKTPVEKSFARADLQWPVDVPVLPRVPADAFKEFEVVVEARDALGVLAQARRISGFLPGDKRVLAINLFACPNHPERFVCAPAACSGAGCEVCANDGECVKVDRIEPADLEPFDDDGMSDAGQVGPDARLPGNDAASDAGREADTGASAPGPEAGPAVDAATNNDAGQDAAAAMDAGADDGGSEAGSDAGSEAGTPEAGPSFVPVRFSATDRAPDAVFLSPDGLRVENRGEDVGNVRSNRAVAPGSGVFYFEGERLIDTPGEYGLGVATSTASLTAPLGTGGNSLGIWSFKDFVDPGEPVCTGLAEFDPTRRNYGFVVDYRAAMPRIHILIEIRPGVIDVVRSCSPALSAPLYIFYSGARYEVGYQIGLNSGADTTNFPFYFSLDAVKGALINKGESAAAQALVQGFGASRALPVSASPSLVRPSDRSVAAGSSVTLMGTASDAEDGDLTSKIEWLDLSSLHHAPVTGSGGSFSFTPGLGRHPVRVSVSDSVGRTRSEIVMVTATGTLPTPSPVRLAGDELSDPDVTLTFDGLGADFEQPQQSGLRANQPNFGQYWYFEAHRTGGPASTVAGLMVREGKLDPIDLRDVPWCATVFMTGFTTYNFNSRDNFNAEYDHYGFAVDYRGEHPIVYVLVGSASAPQGAQLASTIVMTDVWTPVYPFVSGVWLSDDRASDVTLNFGSDLQGKPFLFTPLNVLGPDRAAGLKLGWGAHAQ
jgi:hypothetical protein